MDLYIQVGVLLLFLAALALFIYIYTAPAQQFTAKINDTNQKINDRLVTVEGMDVAPFMNSISTPGTTVYPIIRDARAGKIAILVQTKNSQGLVVNYGYQLRAANTASVKMHPYGNSGVGGAGGTDFEKNFVTGATDVFNGSVEVASGATSLTPTARPFGFGGTKAGGAVTLNAAATNAAADSSALRNITGTPYTPRVFFSDPTVDYSSAQTNGRTFASTGFMYTDMVLKMDMPVNDNYSYADNQNSMYRFDKNSTYYSTIIVNANNEIVGLYIEEHGVNPTSAVLGQQMLANGTITQLY